MNSKNLSQKIDSILMKEELTDKKTVSNSGRVYVHETVDVILKNRNFNQSLQDDLDLTEENFNKINDSILKEYVEYCGFNYSNRNQAIQILFENNKVNQDVIFSLEDKQREEQQEYELKEVFENYNKVIEEDFQTKFGEDVDFRNIEEKQIFEIGSLIYEQLDNFGKEDWKEYISILKENNVDCFYDTETDKYIVKKLLKEDIQERYLIEEADKKIIENIIKPTSFTLLEVRGLPKSTYKDYVIETIVEKDGQQTLIEYHDTQLRKPWKIANNEFQFLQEALQSIIPPTKDFYKEKSSEVKKPTILTKIIKENYNKTDNLPLAESQRREMESKKLISKLDKLHNSDNIIELLEEGVKVKTNKGNGIVRHIDWIYGTVNINTKEDNNGISSFVSNVSFDDISEVGE